MTPARRASYIHVLSTLQTRVPLSKPKFEPLKTSTIGLAKRSSSPQMADWLVSQHALLQCKDKPKLPCNYIKSHRKAWVDTHIVYFFRNMPFHCQMVPWARGTIFESFNLHMIKTCKMFYRGHLIHTFLQASQNFRFSEPLNLRPEMLWLGSESALDLSCPKISQRGLSGSPMCPASHGIADADSN